MTDWKVGDEAVCVDPAPRLGSQLLECGQVYVVSGLEVPGKVSPQNGRLNAGSEIALILEGVTSVGCVAGEWWAGFRVSRFRKVVRDKHEACEPEFITLLKRSKVSA